jgi:ribosome-associated translation inhibitor RaiA
MQVLVNSDHHVTGSESVSERVETVVRDAVGRFADRITRIEVHLNDVNGAKLGENDKRCMMEARVGGLKPIAVTAYAGSLAEAINSAADKLERALESTLGRLDETPGRQPRESEIADTEALDRLDGAQPRR